MKRLATVVTLLACTTAIAQTPPPAPSPATTPTAPPATAPSPATPPNATPPAPAPSTADLEAAKTHFAQGIALFNDGNFSAALAEFGEAYRLHPSPGVLYNIGLTQKALFRYAESIESLERYLGESMNLPPERRAEVLELVSEMKALLADVTVEVAPAKATVTVDGRPAGQAPLSKPLAIAAGNHSVEISAEGYTSQKRDIMVSAGVPMTIHFNLVAIPRTGIVKISSNITPSTIAVDGKVLGMAPVSIELGAGGHTLEVTAPKYSLHREELVVAAGQTREVPITLTREIPRAMWYQHWYVWTPIAAVLAGTAVALGVTLGTHQGPVEGTLSPGAGSAQ